MVHAFYLLLIFVACSFTWTYVESSLERRVREEVEWSYKRQYDATRENRKLQRELDHAFETNRQLHRRCR